MLLYSVCIIHRDEIDIDTRMSPRGLGVIGTENTCTDVDLNTVPLLPVPLDVIILHTHGNS